MSSKGLSSVIGAVLLVTISVGAATSAWVFIDSVTEQTQQNVEDRINQESQETKSDLTSQIAYNGTHGHTIITLRNSGSISLELQDSDESKKLDMYIDGTPLEGDQYAWEFIDSKSGRFLLDPTESEPINTTAKFPDNNEEQTIEFYGPQNTRTTYICYNSGESSC